jgi:hypothetical protein
MAVLLTGSIALSGIAPAAAGGDPLLEARSAARSGDGAKTGDLMGTAVARAH